MSRAERAHHHEFRRTTKELRKELHSLIADARVLANPEEKNKIEDMDEFLAGLARKTVLIINAGPIQSWRIKRLKAKATKDEPKVREEVDRLLNIGIEVRAEEEIKNAAKMGDYFADKLKARLRKRYGVSTEEPAQTTTVAATRAEHPTQQEQVVFQGATATADNSQPAVTAPTSDASTEGHNPAPQTQSHADNTEDHAGHENGNQGGHENQEDQGNHATPPRERELVPA